MRSRVVRILIFLFTVARISFLVIPFGLTIGNRNVIDETDQKLGHKRYVAQCYLIDHVTMTLQACNV